MKIVLFYVKMKLLSDWINKEEEDHGRHDESYITL